MSIEEKERECSLPGKSGPGYGFSAVINILILSDSQNWGKYSLRNCCILQTIALLKGYESDDGVIMKFFDVAKSSTPIKNPFDGFGALLYLISMQATGLFAFTNIRSISVPVCVR